VLANEPQYHAYLLRCWRELPAHPGDASADWRFALEQVGPPPQRYGFGSLEAVFVFLREALESPSAHLEHTLSSHHDSGKGDDYENT